MREEAYLEKLVTIGAQSFLSLQLFDGSLINVAIIDTAGQEKFRSMNNQYLNKVDGILLVYDITSEDSFEEIKNYYCSKIKEYCKENVIIIILPHFLYSIIQLMFQNIQTHIHFLNKKFP